MFLFIYFIIRTSHNTNEWKEICSPIFFYSARFQLLFYEAWQATIMMAAVKRWAGSTKFINRPDNWKNNKQFYVYVKKKWKDFFRRAYIHIKYMLTLFCLIYIKIFVIRWSIYNAIYKYLLKENQCIYLAYL